ncbi:hypothetical protein PTQ27_01285 [Mannheimia sp. AT1]|uniref:Phage protein n=1 Tax=Mannheimia cairinae TaxID=3025936 RepID=A0ABT5MLP4_9PAST|nr:hypothetical protein [Mannheimia cairinae]MDD0823107.1 hypothetical protein [Mannheimia cairinae]MDD0825868.1 hypothetical protein [Mannheimia cairinae]
MAKKLFKLKKWLTLEETAKRLSTELEDEVTAADVLQLAIDKVLRISVNFPHDWKGKNCDVTTDVEKANQYTEVIGLDGKPFKLCEYEKCSETEYIKILSEIYYFEAGVYELKLIGNEKLDLEFMMKLENDLPAVDVIQLNGFYVLSSNGTVIERQSRLYKNFCDLATREIDSFDYPCAGIADIEGAFFVIQTEHINEFLDSLEEDEPSKLSLDNALYLIAEMLRATKSKNKKWTQGDIIDEILLYRQNRDEKANGLEKRMIEEYFLTANKKLKSN